MKLKFKIRACPNWFGEVNFFDGLNLLFYYNKWQKYISPVNDRFNKDRMNKFGG